MTTDPTNLDTYRARKQPVHPDDRPHDPATAATNALRALGHTPGPQPIRQLRDVATAALEDVRQSAARQPHADGTTADTHTRLLETAVNALALFGETELDALEQRILANGFGLPGGEAS